jgi:hypothetical protein
MDIKQKAVSVLYILYILFSGGFLIFFFKRGRFRVFEGLEAKNGHI